MTGAEEMRVDAKWNARRMRCCGLALELRERLGAAAALRWDFARGRGWLLT